MDRIFTLTTTTTTPSLHPDALHTWPEVRRWAEPQTPPLGTPPRRVGDAPPTVGLSNGGRPGNHTMGPTNEEASGQEKKPLPPEEKVWLFGPAEWRDGVLVAGAFASSRDRGVLPSSEDRV